MKNVAKKSTSLKPNNPPQNGLQERLSNGFAEEDDDADGADDDMTVEPTSSDANGGDEDIGKAVVISDDVVCEAEDGDNTMQRNSISFDDNSNDSLLEVSCVNVVDDPNVQKSPFNEGNAVGSRSSTPASVIEASPPSKDLSGAVNGAGDNHTSDDEVIFCEPSSPDSDPSSKNPTSLTRSTAADNSDNWRTNGPVYRVENCEIFENKTDVEPDDVPSKPDGVGDAVSAADDKDVEVIDIDSSTPAVVGATTAQRSGVKRNLPDSSPNDVNQQKKSRLEAAEAEVLTSFVSTQHVGDRESKVVLTHKQLNDLILSCIEDFLNKSHGSVIKQLRTEIDDLRRSRDHWKVIANQMRKQVALVQTAQQRTERRRSSNSRVQKRSVSCQAYIKIPTGNARSPSRATPSSANAALDAAKLATMTSLATPTQLLGSLGTQSPSILPPASANLVGTQRLRLIHQPNIRNPMNAIMNGPLRPPMNVTMLPMTVRPPPQPMMMPQNNNNNSSSSVMIDLTAEEDIRLKQPSSSSAGVDTLIPANLLGSVVRPGNVVLTQSNSNAYFLYAPPLRSSMLKPGSELEVSGTGGLPAGLTLGTSIAPGTSYHSLPSLVSVNNRHPGTTLLQVVNMRPPPPLQSAPLRPTALQQSQPLAILPSPAAPTRQTPLVHQHHPAPLPAPPGVQPVPPGAKQIAPKPTLKLSRVAQGIVLSWNATINTNQEEPSTYQLYAYQQGVEPANSSLWKKVGNVKALALPMACTLTQFQVGNKYHFAVRAVDQFGRVGPFSEPGSIHLEGGST